MPRFDTENWSARDETAIHRDKVVCPEIVHIDAHIHIYGGSDMGNMGAVTAEPQPLHGKPAQAMVTLPPLATLYFMQDG